MLLNRVQLFWYSLKGCGINMNISIYLKGNIKEAVIDIPQKLHNSLIGAKGKFIRSVMEECGGVMIRFPQEGSKSDKVIIRGPAADVENAKQQLMNLADERVRHIWHE